MNYQFAEDALRPWLQHSSKTVEPRTLEHAIKDILSLPKLPPLSKEEMEVFNMVFSIMARENRNWRSISQIALPLDEIPGEAKGGFNAKLKSRVGLPVHGADATPAAPVPNEQMQVRRRFLDLVSMCIPMEERERYPHILTLVDSHVVRTSLTPSNDSTGVDAAAWCIVNYLSTAMQWERGVPMQEHRITPEMSLDVVEAHYASALSKMEARIDARPWRKTVRETPASVDSLFARLLVSAALNRHCLETWAFENRLNEVLPMQVSVFNELSRTVPDGLEKALSAVAGGRPEVYLLVVEQALAPTFATKRKTMTDKVINQISRQVDTVIASVHDHFFENEMQLNQFLADYEKKARLLLWIMLTWCYQHEFEIATELPGANRPKVVVVSSRAKLLVESQHMSTLRRMLSTPAFSLQWERPSGRRLELHAKHISAMRTLVRSKLEECLRGASLAQWQALGDLLAPRDAFCTLMEHAEVGDLVKNYADFDRVSLTL